MTPQEVADRASARYAASRPWVGGYTCGDPDCCYDQDRYTTEAEARERLAIFDPDLFDVWIEYRPIEDQAAR